MPPAAAFGAYAPMDPEAAPLWPAGADAAAEYGVKPSLAQRRKRKWNSCSLLVAVFLPWTIFVTVFAVMSYHFPRSLNWSSFVGSAQLSFFICALCLLIVLALGLGATRAWKKPRVHGLQEPTWYTLLFISTLIAWVVGLECGNANYQRNMRPWVQLTNAGTYRAVDPSLVPGASVADAGRVYFEDGSHVSTKLATAYMDTSAYMSRQEAHTYCIAPFVTDKNVTNPSYDFWTVGIDCCQHSGTEDTIWWCNRDQLPGLRAASALRWQHDDQGFRLALQQAEARFNITVATPIFLTSANDADATVASLQDKAIQYYLTGMFVFFAFQVALVASAVCGLTYLNW